jgi:hypothetical protein
MTKNLSVVPDALKLRFGYEGIERRLHATG